MKHSPLAFLCIAICALCVGLAFPAPAQTLYFAGDSTLDDGNDGLLTDAPRLDDWAEAMREVAKGESVDLVDMREMTRKAANDAGEEEALTWYAPGDRTHPAVKGARLYASLFLANVRKRGLAVSKLFVPDSDNSRNEKTTFRGTERQQFEERKGNNSRNEKATIRGTKRQQFEE